MAMGRFKVRVTWGSGAISFLPGEVFTREDATARCKDLLKSAKKTGRQQAVGVAAFDADGGQVASYDLADLV